MIHKIRKSQFRHELTSTVSGYLVEYSDPFRQRRFYALQATVPLTNNDRAREIGDLGGRDGFNRYAHGYVRMISGSSTHYWLEDSDAPEAVDADDVVKHLSVGEAGGTVGQVGYLVMTRHAWKDFPARWTFQPAVPHTNSGRPCADGWLGSHNDWNDYALGMHEVISSDGGSIAYRKVDDTVTIGA